MKKNEMTPLQLAKRYALYGALVGALTLGVSCSSDKNVKVNQYKSVETVMVEDAKGNYKIESEKTISDTMSRVIVKKKDGTIDTMKTDEVKKMYADKNPMKGYNGASTNQAYYSNHNSDLWFILFWSNYGYGLGRPYDTGIHNHYYSSPNAYQQAKTTQTSVVASRKVATVPKTSSKTPIKSTSKYSTTSYKSYKTNTTNSSRSYSSSKSSGSRSFGG
jgi:hypothetical protein